MIAGGSHTIPADVNVRLTIGFREMALVGDLDIHDTATCHRLDWRPAPTEDCPLRAAAVEAIRAELLRERRGRA